MGTCFVIQPFDQGTFDKRFEDHFAPAIRAAGLEPYRVDRDHGVRVPIASIQEGIKNADACLADITTNNPNVWYELGYALASNKEVVLVCSSERPGDLKFPRFHRHFNKRDCSKEHLWQQSVNNTVKNSSRKRYV